MDGFRCPGPPAYPDEKWRHAGPNTQVHVDQGNFEGREHLVPVATLNALSIGPRNVQLPLATPKCIPNEGKMDPESGSDSTQRAGGKRLKSEEYIEY